MKKFDDYVAALDIKPVPTLTTRFAAYKGGEVTFFDTLKDAKAFSPMYEKIQDSREILLRAEIVKHNSTHLAQMAQANELFWCDLRKETKLNSDQIEAIFEFADNYDITFDTKQTASSNDNQAEFVRDICCLIFEMESLKDKQ
jgi:hypothetical protein